MSDDGRWLTAAQAHVVLFASFGVDILIPGWIYGLPEHVPYANATHVYTLLGDLHREGRVERKQPNPGTKPVYWRGLPPIEVPDTLPAGWTREPVAA